MATMATTYAPDVSIRQDLWDDIKDLDAINTYVTSNAGSVPVKQKLHSWVVDPIAVVNSQVGIIEGAATVASNTDPTTLSNYTQIIEYGFQVSASDENSDHAAFSSRFAREQMKNMKLWKNQYEYSSLRGTASAGTVSAARTMGGVRSFAVSNVDNATAGTSLTSTILNTNLGNAAQLGAEMNTLLVGKDLKSKISSFTVGNVRNIDAKSAELVGRVDVYDSDFGRMQIVMHRNVAAGEIIGYISDYVLTGSLDEAHYEDRAKTGYFKTGSIVGETTIQVSNEKAVMLMTSYTGA